MTPDTIRISLARQFSPLPAGRTREDGPKSGEAFREDLLLPKIRQAEKEGGAVEVSLDGVEGVASSFLEEAFGGLIRKRHYTAERLDKLLRFAEPEEPGYSLYIRVIKEHMAEAKPE